MLAIVWPSVGAGTGLEDGERIHRRFQHPSVATPSTRPVTSGDAQLRFDPRATDDFDVVRLQFRKSGTGCPLTSVAIMVYSPEDERGINEIYIAAP